MSFTNKNIVITGGGSGIGRATCLRFAKEGANIAILDLNESGSRETLTLLEAYDIKAISLTVDVGDEAQVNQAITESVAQLGGIDILVNNVGIHSQVRITELSLAEWNNVLKTNLTSVFLTCRAVIPHLINRSGGSIVNVSSVHSLATIQGYSAYAAAKGGMNALTRAMALDLAGDNIRVNAVLPGAVHTPMLEIGANAEISREEVLKSWDDAQPLGRVGRPEEIATSILMVANPENSFMTGSCLVVDGGMTAEL